MDNATADTPPRNVTNDASFFKVGIEGGSSHELSRGGAIGIGIGGSVLVLALIGYLIWLVRRRRHHRESAIVFDMTDLRHGSSDMLDRSWRRSDEEHNLRPISNESSGSYHFDTNALRTRENAGRLSYDTPYSTIQKLEADQSEVQRRQNTNSLDRRVVAGYGLVSMVSQSYYVTDLPDTNDYLPPYSYAVNGITTQGQGQSGRLPKYSTEPDPRVQLRPGITTHLHEHNDSFRSSMGVDLGADIERAQRIIF